MKVCVINGSPKGKLSTTLYTVLYLQKKFKNFEFEILNVGQKIKHYEKNFDEVKKSVESADLILFAYPVYTFLAPSQLHRLIRLLKEKNLNLSGKFATQITTSKHFYDVTAHNYIEENCYDLGLKFIKGLSADMDDLLKKHGQENAVKFFEYVEFCIENNIYENPKTYKKPTEKYVRKLEEVQKNDDFKTIILTDCSDDNENLKNMIDDFKAIYPYNTKTINISKFSFAGGCLGCNNCVFDGKCIYNDGFENLLRNEILTADATIYAFEIKDHSMGHLFKCFDDRQFCNGHRFMTVGMPVGYLVYGNYEDEDNLKFLLNSKSDVAHNFLCGVATDADAIKSMTSKLVYSLKNKYHLPQTFYGVGGRKIFRDLVYVMRGIMKADHNFYKHNGVYDDLPHKSMGKMMFLKLYGMTLNSSKGKPKPGSKMNNVVIEMYKKVVEKAE